MARTRGAAKKVADDPVEDVPIADQNLAGEVPLVAEKPVPKPRRTRPRRGTIVEEQQETDEQEALNVDAVTTDAEGEEEEEADGELGERGRLSRSRSRAGKGSGRKDKEKPEEAQLVSFPSIMDEGVNNTGTMAPFPEPYIPKSRYTPVIPATPKRTMSNVPPKTPKFDPEIHGKDLEKDFQEDNGVDTFEQLIKRSPRKNPMDNKNLDMPAPLALEDVQFMEIQLPAQTEEERKLLTEEPVQTEEPIYEVKVLEAPKSRATRKNAPAIQATPLTVRKTRAGASAPSSANPVATATARRGKQPVIIKTTPPPASPPKAISTKTAAASPPRSDSKKPITSSTPSKAPIKTSATAPRGEARGKQTSHVSKPVTTPPPPQAGRKKPTLSTPLRSPVTKSAPTGSPEKSTSSASPKSISKPAPLAQTSPKQPISSSSPRAAGKRPIPTSPPRAPVSQAREAAKKPTERPIAKPVPRKPLGSVAQKIPLKEKKPVVEPSLVEVLPIRVKRVASGPVPPTKRIRPTPPISGAAAGGSQNASAVAPPASRPRIASLNKPPPPTRASKPPTKPTSFRLVGEEVARKQAEAKEARKKRMEEAEAVKASLKEKQAKARKSIPSKTSSAASKSSRDSNISAAVNGQLERELASIDVKKTEGPTKSETPSPPRPGQSRPTKPSVIGPRPALVIQKQAPTTKLTTATSKPAVPAVARGAAGHVSGTVNGTVQPEEDDMQREERIAQADKLRKQAAERGKAAVLAWAAQQKSKESATSSSSTTKTKQAA